MTALSAYAKIPSALRTIFPPSSAWTRYAATGMTPGVQRILEPEVAVPKVGTPHVQRRWYTHAYNRLAFYRLIAVCSLWLPRPVQLRIARAVAMALYWCMPREHAAVQGNLTRVLPDASRQEVERQARQVFDNFACFFADLLGLNRRAFPLQQAYVTQGAWSSIPASGVASPQGVRRCDSAPGELGTCRSATEYIWQTYPCAHGSRTRPSDPTFPAAGDA